VGYHDATSFALNVLLHVLILFTLLSVLYATYISKVETDAFKSEIKSAIGDNLPKTLAANDKDGAFRKVLQGAPLDTLAKLYAKPERATTVYNKWLFRTMAIVVTGIVLTTAIVMLFLYFSCNQCVPFWTILRDNAIVFLLIGVVEFLFFMTIARRFIPSPPSLMLRRVYDDLKNWS
jgi:hypothetical protein